MKTKRLNEQVRRNSDRFPEYFVFRLSKKEWAEVVANCDQLGKILHSSILPTAFTEQGARALAWIYDFEFWIWDVIAHAKAAKDGKGGIWRVVEKSFKGAQLFGF